MTTRRNRLDDLIDMMQGAGADCVLWPYAKSSHGYGQLGISGTKLETHVLACMYRNGERPAGMQAAHSCGTRNCVNPSHLRWATKVENEADKIAHGTANRGARHGMSKLSADQVREIRALRGSGRTASQIGAAYGVRGSAISRIWSGDRWGWLS